MNREQKRAVDLIDGPVMVVAGPGTGKTQLLSMRAGNILRKDPTMLPGNILCLTFTDAAAANMRDRLISLISQDAYKIAIHTFNSFGSWIMSAYPEYFFDWREAATADELTTYRIIEEILERLPGNHALATQSYDGSFLAIKQLQNFIGDCKRNDIEPDGIRDILRANQKTYEKLTPILNEQWPPLMRAKDAISRIEACINKIEQALPKKFKVSEFESIESQIVFELQVARAEAAELPTVSKSKPYTAWKNKWLELDTGKHFAFKAAKHYDKLMAAADVYENYQQKLQQRGLVDFNDQIMTVLKVLKKHDELRWNLQERFQYVMIDEYQDTNRAQLQMAHAITDAPVHEGRPNILVVGDDDQAIYRFQGADMANIKEFETAYRDPEIIPLTTNYRSNKAVMAPARQISTQIEFSLEKQMSISKEPNITVAQHGVGTGVYAFAHDSEHYAWIAAEIKKSMQKNGSGEQEIAVLARERAQLDALVPYLRHQEIPMDYERRENVLDQEHVRVLLATARLICALQESRLVDANALLPEIVSHPMWGIDITDIWNTASLSYKQSSLWLDEIFKQKGTRLREVCDFLFGLSQQAGQVPLEQMLDAIIGITELSAPDTEIDDEVEAKPVQLAGNFVSPFKNYYFGDELFDKKPAEYLTLLSHLACLRRHVREHQQGQAKRLYLADLISFVDAFQRAGLTMLDTAAHREDKHAVRLLTAHKAKGLEFDTVFVVGLNDDVWNKSKGSYSRFSYPQNLNDIKPSDNVADDGLRLLFVAMTRARQNLKLCYFKSSEDGREHQPFAPLVSLDLAPASPSAKHDAAATAAQYEHRWLDRHLSTDHASKHALLEENLAKYRLSATHFNNFLDVTRGGPSYFLTQNLLHFPSAQSANMLYGIAIHETLRQTHERTIAGSKLDISTAVQSFNNILKEMPLTDHDLQQFLRRGTQSLEAYLKYSAHQFSSAQRVELDFRDQGVVLGRARLSGKIDLLDFNDAEKTVTVSDYKTGRAYSKWALPPSAEEFERIKLHHYKNQLLFYKLLIDGSNDWGDKGWQAREGILKFVEPDYYGKIRSLTLNYEANDIEQIERLIHAVWQKIMALDFPDTSSYEPSLTGIKRFEQDLIDGKI